MAMNNKKNIYPSKRTINLNIKDRAPLNLKVIIPLALVLAICIGLFCKFAVIDRIAKAAEAERQAAETEAKLAEIEQKLEKFDEVQAEYERYVSSAFREDNMPRNCTEVIEVLEKHVMPYASINSFSFANDTVKLELVQAEADAIVSILTSLDSDPSVKSKSIETATSDSGVESNLVLTIVLQEVKDEVSG